MNLDELKLLAGVRDSKTIDSSLNVPPPSSINKRQYERDHNIKPGTQEWFKLWFGRNNK